MHDARMCRPVKLSHAPLGGLGVGWGWECVGKTVWGGCVVGECVGMSRSSNSYNNAGPMREVWRGL